MRVSPCTLFHVCAMHLPLPPRPAGHSFAGCLPQTELPVAGGIAVPAGQRLHPLQQPRALLNKGGERRRRHVFGGCDGGAGVSGGGLPSIAEVGVVRSSW
jgi:hypothetical protein